MLEREVTMLESLPEQDTNFTNPSCIWIPGFPNQTMIPDLHGLTTSIYKKKKSEASSIPLHVKIKAITNIAQGFHR